MNPSLSVLHRVIRILSRADRGDMRVPYPEFKLTHILRDSLGENSRTAVIVNIHPDIWWKMMIHLTSPAKDHWIEDISSAVKHDVKNRLDLPPIVSEND
ncbi:hypothetical protein Q1695_001171 [Nippostrongylus brasiliensis]|nr:hypothetical protein Q1695_001171 [Nippostrongylus brasiliensis]